MYKPLVTACLVCLFLLPYRPVPAAPAQCQGEDSLVFDESIPITEKFEFIDEQPELPKTSDFKIISYYPMSNACGERWALVTLLNTSPGTSSITADGLVALFSDGSKKTARNFEERVPGKTRHTQTIYFGKSKFPIVKILTRPR